MREDVGKGLCMDGVMRVSYRCLYGLGTDAARSEGLPWWAPGASAGMRLDNLGRRPGDRYSFCHLVGGDDRFAGVKP